MAGEGFFDEMHGRDGGVRSPYSGVARWLRDTPGETFTSKRQQADLLFQRLGITFAVYGSAGGTERLIPFDIIPRILSGGEWQKLQKGLFQRVRALNMLLHDIYHDLEIVKAGVIPSAQILGNELYRPEMKDLDLPGGVYVHIAGIDIVRVAEGEFYVLEDNLRTPSGVSYMLENRAVMMRLFPGLFPTIASRRWRIIRPNCCAAAFGGAGARRANPTVAVLTPGPYNSAYFEHAFLAEEMGIELVEGQDLFVRDDAVWMRTTEGPRKVDVIYRRIDDLPRPPRLRSRLHAGRAGPAVGLSQRRSRARQRDRHRRRRRQVDLSLRPRHDHASIWARSRSSECSDLSLRPRRRPRLCAGASAELVVKETQGIRRLRHAGRAEGDRGRAREVPRA